jgi:hypothetical protein
MLILLILFTYQLNAEKVPENCKIAFPATDYYFSGCNICNDGFGRKRTNPPNLRAYENKNRVL